MSDQKKTEVPAVVTAAKDITESIPADAGFTPKQLEIIQKTVVQAMLAVNGTTKPVLTPAQTQNADKGPQCIECFQYESACKGKHVKMVVYPVKYPEFASFWPGCRINGVRYLSDHESDEITVPANCESTIRSMIHNFEQNERTVNMNRKKKHNSGSIGPSGKGPNHAVSAWR